MAFNAPSPRALIPITIGVIGHRDLLVDEVDRVRSQIREVVAAYRAHFPLTPILLLTALAEGADEIAVEGSTGVDGVDVVAVLPMPLAKYESDFRTHGSLEHFRNLASSASWVIVADEFTGSGTLEPLGDAFVMEGQAGRDAAYQRCGRFVSVESHILIAVWDGRPPELIGGTADTLFFRLPDAEALPDRRKDLALWPVEQGIQIHIPAGRRRHGQRAVAHDGDAIAPSMHTLGDHLEAEMWDGVSGDEVAGRIEALNRLIRARPLPMEHDTSVTHAILTVADAEAGRLQRRFRRLSAGVLIAGVCALVMVNFEQSFSQRWLFGSTATILIATGALWWVLNRVGLKDRYQQFRALAEGARVQDAWLASGIQTCPSDTFLRGQSDVEWIRRALRAAWFADRIAIRDRALADAQPFDREVSSSVASDWMRGQFDYFMGAAGNQGAIDRNRRKSRRYKYLSTTGLGLALLGIVPNTVRFLSGLDIPDWENVTGQALWEVGLGTAAASAAYAQLMAFSEASRQFATSAQIYRQGLAGLARASREPDYPERAQAANLRVGREALRETSSWLALNRDRTVRPV